MPSNIPQAVLAVFLKCNPELAEAVRTCAALATIRRSLPRQSGLSEVYKAEREAAGAALATLKKIGPVGQTFVDWLNMRRVGAHTHQEWLMGLEALRLNWKPLQGMNYYEMVKAVRNELLLIFPGIFRDHAAKGAALLLHAAAVSYVIYGAASVQTGVAALANLAAGPVTADISMASPIEEVKPMNQDTSVSSYAEQDSPQEGLSASTLHSIINMLLEAAAQDPTTHSNGLEAATERQRGEGGRCVCGILGPTGDVYWNCPACVAKAEFSGPAFLRAPCTLNQCTRFYTEMVNRNQWSTAATATGGCVHPAVTVYRPLEHKVYQ